MAQQKHRLEIIRVDKGTVAPAELVDLPADFRSKGECRDYLENQLLSQLQLRGYLAASIDSISASDQMTRAFLFLGDPTVGARLPWIRPFPLRTGISYKKCKG